jgi:hypothetical protein
MIGYDHPDYLESSPQQRHTKTKGTKCQRRKRHEGQPKIKKTIIDLETLELKEVEL